MKEIIIEDKHYLGWGEEYCEWFKCPGCGCGNINKEYIFCPKCGNPITFKLSKDEPGICKIKKK